MLHSIIKKVALFIVTFLFFTENGHSQIEDSLNRFIELGTLIIKIDSYICGKYS